ncbi:alpha/beta hydrolase [Devosia sp. J2-20]|jgi:acetyl esterase/lipase|uniref:alpha/beta hydrolase n=1 Tax=Devosia sp. J2-20 TaxID=3026161 RepID=UPI00249B5860|nr:alpha/beta hydrolase [Devosia sp. J2-20]WDQ99790.1 alpha/beta hydrolase [Devosia sp. J2-20]
MAISILGIINSLSPKDAGSRKVARNLAYGPAERQKLDIYAPRDRQDNLPVVVFFYGGSWNDGSRAHYDFVGRALAAQGFVTVIADYRLLPEVEYPGFLDDCATAVEWIAGNIGLHGGDPERLALMGHSAGAYNAVMLALDPGLLKRRGLLGKVRCTVGLSGPYDFFPFDGPISLRTFGAVSEPMSTQPIHFVSASAPPMFLASGDKDTLVYPRNTRALAQRLKVVGVSVHERHYANLGHPGTLLALGRPARRIAPVLKEVGIFLHQHLDVRQSVAA